MSLPNYFNALLQDNGNRVYSEWSTPFSWVCKYCGYPRRITEMISLDEDDPCAFCMSKLMKFRVTETIIVGDQDYKIVDSSIIGINSANPPSGRGGDDSEPFYDLDLNFNDAVYKRFLKKRDNIARINAFVNAQELLRPNA